MWRSGKTVASMTEEGEMKYEGEALEVKEAVCKHMEEWRGKVGIGK